VALIGGEGVVQYADLWHKYRQTKDSSAREALVVAYAPLVRYVAGRMALGLPPQIEVADLESYGLFGLLEAIERYDPGRGFKFETYALTRIRGAIIDGLRAESWAPALKQKAKQLEAAYVEMESKLGRPPSDDELAGRMGISREELHKREAEVAAAVLVSLDEPASSGTDESEALTVSDKMMDPTSPDPEMEALLTERRDILAESIERLPEKERLVVTLFYYEGLTAKEIAAVMRLSVARISQLHSKAILRLRGRLARAKQVLTG
jgi:RNA polymerase sigma factor FliA